MHAPEPVVSFDEFCDLVDATLTDLVAGLGLVLDNVIVAAEPSHPLEPDLLGLYDGVPLTERSTYGESADGLLAMPDIISIYHQGILAVATDRAAVAAEVRITLIHEIAHHFGIDDERLDQLGWA